VIQHKVVFVSRFNGIAVTICASRFNGIAVTVFASRFDINFKLCPKDFLFILSEKTRSIFIKKTVKCLYFVIEDRYIFFEINIAFSFI